MLNNLLLLKVRVFDKIARSTMRIAWTANVCQYTKLDTKKQQIRLLKLSRPPSAANVLPDRNMIHFDLDTAPEYIALSYTWGDASNNQHIIVGNKAMTIRMNCSTSYTPFAQMMPTFATSGSTRYAPWLLFNIYVD